MNTIRRSRRLFAFTLLVISAGLTSARAGIIQNDATLPPPAGAYLLPTICIPAVCLVNISVSGFENTLDLLVAGNEEVTANATFSADIHQNNSGTPGLFLATLTTPGTMDFTFFGRTFAVPLGTFNAQITDFEFAGAFNGHAFDVRQNPAQASTGQTTIVALLNGGTHYQVDSFFDVFAELSIDGGQFVPDRPAIPT